MVVQYSPFPQPRDRGLLINIYFSANWFLYMSFIHDEQSEDAKKKNSGPATKASPPRAPLELSGHIFLGDFFWDFIYKA